VLLPADERVLAEARATTERVARTFAIACRMLPREVRDDVYLLYLVLRTLDDLVDEARPDAHERVAIVRAWAAGEAEEVGTPEVRILRSLARRHPLPRQAVDEFCLGMESDLCFVPPATEAELDVYCHRVAGTVGVMMSSVLGVRGDEAEAHRAASALGMAMQRTNILRDIDEDHGNGRCYLARETLERYGPARPGRREALLRDQIPRADALYEEGMAGIWRLRSGRRAIAAAGGMYREILRQLERDGYGAQEGRSVVSRRRKLVVAARRGALHRPGRLTRVRTRT
jgi:15-cis-phytoene synthase